jgi:hypothetical protein
MLMAIKKNMSKSEKLRCALADRMAEKKEEKP